MGYRYREQIIPGTPGSMSMDELGYSIPGAEYTRLLFKCEDVTGNRDGDNPLSMRKVTTRFDPLNGPAKRPSDGRTIATCSAYVPEGIGYPFPMDAPDSDSLHVPSVLARSNPSRPYVDTGVFLGELRDFPAMGKSLWDASRRIVRSIDKSLSRIDRLNLSFKKAALEVFSNPDEYFIATQFGYLPFISDVMKYCNAGEQIQKRAEELKRARATGNSSKRVSLDSDQVHSVDPRYRLSSLGVSFYAELVVASSYKRWGVGKWSLEPDGPLARVNTTSELMALTRRAVYGADVDASTAWNLMPWSWLIDWASNAGDWIESSRNTLGFSRSGTTTIMTQGIGLWSTRRKPGIHDFYADVTGGNFDITFDRKLRTVHSSYDMPSLSIPILTGKQTAILGSLATLRARGIVRND